MNIKCLYEFIKHAFVIAEKPFYREIHFQRCPPFP